MSRLAKKGFGGFDDSNRSHSYFPLVSEEDCVLEEIEELPDPGLGRARIGEYRAKADLHGVDEAIEYSKRQSKGMSSARQSDNEAQNDDMAPDIAILESALASYARGDSAGTRATLTGYSGKDDRGLRRFFDRLELRLRDE